MLPDFIEERDRKNGNAVIVTKMEQLARGRMRRWIKIISHGIRAELDLDGGGFHAREFEQFLQFRRGNIRNAKKFYHFILDQSLQRPPHFFPIFFWKFVQHDHIQISDAELAGRIFHLKKFFFDKFWMGILKFLTKFKFLKIVNFCKIAKIQNLDLGFRISKFGFRVYDSKLMFLGFGIQFLVILSSNFVISIKILQKLTIFRNLDFVKNFKICQKWRQI